MQLRTGQIGFRHFLWKRKVPDVTDPYCQHCGGTEEMTVEHVVLQCPKWADRRHWEPGARLGRLLAAKSSCVKVLKLVADTGLLAQFQHCDMKGGTEEEE